MSDHDENQAEPQVDVIQDAAEVEAPAADVQEPTPEELAALLESVDKSLDAARQATGPDKERSIPLYDPGEDVGPSARMAAYHFGGLLISVGVPIGIVAKLEGLALSLAGGVSDVIEDARGREE